MNKVRDQKRCSTCKQTYQISNFHRNRTRPDGHSADCKECAKERSREYGRRVHGHRTLLPRLSTEERKNYKRCPTCRVIKTLDKFYRTKGRSDGHDYQCKLCANERKKIEQKRRRALSRGEQQTAKRIIRIENKINADNNRKLDNFDKRFIIERVDIRSKSNKPLPIDDVMDKIEKLYPTTNKIKR